MDKTEVQAAYCRRVVETDDFGKPVRFCSKPITLKARQAAGERLGLGRPVMKPYCQEHLERLPYWPN